MKRIALIGGGGLANEISDVIYENGDVIIGYFALKKTSIKLNFFGSKDDFYNYSSNVDYFVLAIGATDRNNLEIRKKVIRKLKSQNIKLGKVISKKSTISKSAKISKGSYIANGAVIGPNVKIGPYSIIGSNSVVSHDSVVGSNVSIYPMSAISGNVNIKNNVIIGTGSRIISGVNISTGAITSIGSNVFSDIKSNKTVFLRNF
tara:strand:+ start:716 stop:1327 length:612 start_codon:yes stop_codon:yes gene_type:complete